MTNQEFMEYWGMLTPMKYGQERDREGLSENLKKKYDAMINNENSEFIATEKHDGEWAMFIRGETVDDILIRSRSISKVTGKYGDYTVKLPHLVEEMKNWPAYSVFLGEICWDEYGTVSTDVGTILRCLPPKAVERQKEKKLSVYLFDTLCYDNVDMLKLGYFDRYVTLNRWEKDLEGTNAASGGSRKAYFKITAAYLDNNFAADADVIIAAGGEGVVIQRKDYIYEPGCRTAWKTIKLKQSLPHMELKVIGLIEPKKYYEGDCPESWSYLDNEGNLVTKPYYYGWKNGIIVELPDGETCEVASGLTDADREWLATEDAAAKISNGELYAVVKAMSFNTKGKLRHPSLVRLRGDM